MTSTLAVVLRLAEHVWIGHVGDSRVYRLREGQLDLLTADHREGSEPGVGESFTQADRARAPRERALSRALGRCRERPARAMRLEELRAGDVILLATHGLTRLVDDAEVADVLRARSDVGAAATTLVSRANERAERHGRHTITVVAGRWTAMLSVPVVSEEDVARTNGGRVPQGGEARRQGRASWCNMAVKVVDRLFIVACGAAAPSECKVEKPPTSRLVERHGIHDRTMQLVVTDGGAPTRAQARKLDELRAGRTVPTAVVSSSVRVRWLGTFLSWFNRQTRTFRAPDLREALTFLEIPWSRADLIEREVSHLRRKLDGRPLGEHTAGGGARPHVEDRGSGPGRPDPESGKKRRVMKSV